jgi:hypothetical protein
LERGYNALLDREDIASGEQWQERLRKLILASEVVRRGEPRACRWIDITLTRLR